MENWALYIACLAAITAPNLRRVKTYLTSLLSALLNVCVFPEGFFAYLPISVLPPMEVPNSRCIWKEEYPVLAVLLA